MSDHGLEAQIQVAPNDTFHCGKGSMSFDAYRMEYSLKSTHWREHQIDKEKQNQDVSTVGLDIYLMTSLTSELMEARGLLQRLHLEVKGCQVG